jgi:HD-GYP domain-containing protein (c-di-GMP phosphodiesterase class II)
LAPFIRHHHEWWDGSGYPDNLAGEQIPLEARIIALSDAVESMASDRPYHQAMQLDEIVTEIQNCAGTQFDPVVAQIFVRILNRQGRDLVVNSAREVVRKVSGKEPAPTWAGWANLDPA